MRVFDCIFLIDKLIMMRTLTSITQRLVNNASKMAFSSTHGHQSNHAEDAVIITRHNPHGEKDLRGFEHLEKLNENEKSYSPLHSTVTNPFALYSIFSWFPNGIARNIGKIVAHPKTALASDSLYLPKITQNGIPIYDSVEKVSTYLTINKLWTRVAPFILLAIAPQPALAALTYGILSYVYFSTNWTVSKNFVIKAELSPQTEEIVYQKFSIFGEINTYRAKISDLESTTLENIYGENSHSEKSIRGLLNREVAFRIKSTNELLLFDKTGIWNEEGVNHSLLL